MRSALAELPGVDQDDVTIDFAAKTATVTFDGAEVPSPEAIVAAFEGTKFSAKVRD